MALDLVAGLVQALRSASLTFLEFQCRPAPGYRPARLHHFLAGVLEDFLTQIELGLSPRLTVLDEAAAETALKNALAMVADEETAAELQDFQSLFDKSLDWHFEGRRLIEAARANGIDADELRSSASRSIEALEQCLGAADADGAAIDRVLLEAIDGALAAIDLGLDETAGTAEYVKLLRESRQNLMTRWRTHYCRGTAVLHDCRQQQSANRIQPETH